jgi:hypothetical protein
MLASFLSNPARRNGLAAKALTRLVAESGSSPMAVVTLFDRDVPIIANRCAARIA